MPVEFFLSLRSRSKDVSPWPVTRALIVTALLCVVSIGTAVAETVGIGETFLVNTYTTDGQALPVVAAHPRADGYVVAWESYGTVGDDTDRASVQARRFDASGQAIGGQFQVNDHTPSEQTNTAVAMADDGTFVVSWMSYRAPGDQSSYATLARVFSADGVALASEIQVNETVVGDQRFPDVAWLEGGDFMVVWRGPVPVSGSLPRKVMMRRISRDGQPIGGEVMVEPESPESDQNELAIASLADGGFVIVWQSIFDDGPDEDAGIRGRRFSSSGAPIGTSFQVNSTLVDLQDAADVVGTADGGFVVVWRSRRPGDFLRDIRARRFDAMGVPVAADFVVNLETSFFHRTPSLTALADGRVLIVWRSENLDTDEIFIPGRLFDTDGIAVGEEPALGTIPSVRQAYPDVATGPGGGILITWYGDPPPDIGEQDFGIYARRLVVEGADVLDTIDIPTLSAVGAVALALLLSLAGWVALRRRH